MPSTSHSFCQAIEDANFDAIQKHLAQIFRQKHGPEFFEELIRLASQKIYVSRLLPVLQCCNREQLIGAGLKSLVLQLEQIAVPASIHSFACFAPGWYVISGCRPSPDSVEVVILSADGKWILHEISNASFRHELSRYGEHCLGYNYSFFGVIRCAELFGIQGVWINGTRVSYELQNISNGTYISQVDDLLHLFRLSQVPLDILPNLIPNGAFELVKVLSEPLRRQNNWIKCIRQENCFGEVPSASAQATIVIPLYRLWHQFMQGHLAAFSMDSDFLSGQTEVMYVVDDPAIEYQILNWSRIYLHDCPYPVRIVSLTHNYGFGMACNVGVQAVHTPHVVLMNSDVMPIQPGWLQEMKLVWTQDPTALLSAVLLYDNFRVQHCGMKLAFSGTQSSPVPCNIHSMKGVHLDQLNDYFQGIDVINVFAMTGALLAFNREPFLQVGGFDPIFGRGDFEDVDLSLRWKEAIGPLLVTRAAQLIHLERQTMNILVSEQRQWQERFNSCCAWHLNQTIQQQAEDAWS